MKNRKLINFLVVGFQTLLITGIALCSAANISCKISAEGIKLLAGDYESPKIVDFQVQDAKTLVLTFDEKVTVTGCSVSVVKEEVSSDTVSGGDVHTELAYEENLTVVKILLNQNMTFGENYELYGIVADVHGNTLTFGIPFLGYNERVPELVMTEIQAKSVSSQTSKEKTAGTYRSEFIEFLALSDGNLCGLEIISGYDGEEKKYVFPSVEVSKGEVFTVHLRTRGAGCISETGSDLTLATSSYTSPSVRDIWSSQEATVLGNKTDVVILKNQFNGKIMDAAFYRSSTVEVWTKDMETLAVEACKAGIYDSFEIENASSTDGITDTKTISRSGMKELYDKVMNSEQIQYPVKSDVNSWYVSEVSPGTI